MACGVAWGGGGGGGAALPRRTGGVSALPRPEWGGRGPPPLLPACMPWAISISAKVTVEPMVRPRPVGSSGRKRDDMPTVSTWQPSGVRPEARLNGWHRVCVTLGIWQPRDVHQGQGGSGGHARKSDVDVLDRVKSACAGEHAARIRGSCGCRQWPLRRGV